MATLTELLQAWDRLDKGVTQYATTRAINDANEQVRQLREQSMDENARIEGFKNVAQDITRRLVGLGHDASAVKQITDSFNPADKLPPIQSALQGLNAGLNPGIPEHAAQIRQNSRDYLKSVSGEKMALAQAKAAGEARREDAKQYAGMIKDFGKDHKDLIDGYTKLELTPDDLTNPLNFANSKRASIRASGDSKISDADFKAANVDKSLWASLQSFVDGKTDGSEFQGNANLMRALADTARVKSAKALHVRLQSASERALEVGKDPEELQRSILNRYLGGSNHFYGFLNGPHQRTRGTEVINEAPSTSPPAGPSGGPSKLPPGVYR